MATVAFEEIGHRYLMGGRLVPSVTQILSEVGFCDYSQISEEYAILGSHVHLACELYDKNNLDESSVIPLIAGYLRSYQEFRRVTGFVPILIEEKLGSDRYRYATTLDRFGQMPDEKYLLLELKSGVKEKWHRYQTAGQEICLYERIADLKRFSNFMRGALYLQPDGSLAKFIEHRSIKDEKIFLAALICCHAMREDS